MVEKTSKYHLRFFSDRGKTLDLRPIKRLPVVTVGTSGERPPARIPGRLFFETDTGSTYLDDGHNWQGFGGGASQLSGLSDVGTVSYTAGQVLRADGVDYNSDVLHHTDLDIISYNDHHGVGSGIIWDGSDNIAHAAAVVHESGGALEINVAGLSGQLADVQNVEVEDSGALVNPFDNINFATNLSVTDDGDGTCTVDASGAGAPTADPIKTVNQGTVTLGDGENMTLWRATLPTGKQIKVIEAGIQPSGTASLLIEVYNQTDAASIYSNNVSYDDGSYGTPLAFGGTADDVEIRLSNASGAVKDCSGWVTFVVE